MKEAKTCRPGFKNVNDRCIKKEKGLIVDIYKNPLFKGCSLWGVSESHDEALLVMDEPSAQVFEESDEIPTLRVVRRNLFGSEYIHAEPVKKAKGSYAAGGSYIATSDSRFREFVNPYPISLHDRDMALER